MADNYLERKMAEHQAGKVRGGGAPASARQARRGVLALPFAPQRIAVTGCEAPVLDALLTTLRSTGSVVEYCPTEADLEALTKRLGTLDVVINIVTPQTVEIRTQNTRTVTASDPTALARLAAVLSAPALRTTQFTIS